MSAAEAREWELRVMRERELRRALLRNPAEGWSS